ncbi:MULTISPECIES: hypothetical protein [unclassified Psychrobacillus]|uniref:hypothetical protein n=1 Tax=unclassified Psychrobacillus TaxID=2636677 RepID=UPI0030F62367
MKDLIMKIAFWVIIASSAAIAVGVALALGKVTLGWALFAWLFPFAIKAIVVGILGFVVMCIAAKGLEFRKETLVKL